MGRGVYLTAKPPRCASDSLLSNNYGQALPTNQSKVESYVRVDADTITAENGSKEMGRNVWKASGSVDATKTTGAVVGNRQSKGKAGMYKEKVW